MAASALGRKMKPAWPAWSLAGSVLATAGCTVAMALPAQAATVSTASPWKAVQAYSAPRQDATLTAQMTMIREDRAAATRFPQGPYPTHLRIDLPSGKTIKADVAAYYAQQAAIKAGLIPPSIPAYLTSFQTCVIARESGGNAQIMNASGHYGLYQFAYSTWLKYGGKAADFGHASVAEQDRVFLTAMSYPGGAQNWTPSDGCVYGGGPITTAATQGGTQYPLRAISGLVVGRIDEGQDFCGSGPIYGIYTGVIMNTYGVWPGGAYIMERLTSGPRAGSIVYFAESIIPKVAVGQNVGTNTVIGQMYASNICIEIGWSTSTPNVALGNPGYVDGHPTAAGYDMEAFLKSL